LPERLNATSAYMCLIIVFKAFYLLFDKYIIDYAILNF